MKLLYAGLFLLCILQNGCSSSSLCENLAALAAKPDTESYLREWVEKNLPSSLEKSPLVSYVAAGGLGFYRLDVDFDWAELDSEIEGGGVKLLGSLSRPAGVVFLTSRRCAIIYRLNNEDLIGVSSIQESELKRISDRLVVFDP